MKIKIFTIGKVKSHPIRALVEDYLGRLNHYITTEIVALKTDERMSEEADNFDFVIVLDERGKQLSSVDISRLISDRSLHGTKGIAIFIGGEDGVSSAVKKKADLVLSFSPMTFPHELIQVILLEQLYRACTIMRGEPYHRG